MTFVVDPPPHFRPKHTYPSVYVFISCVFTKVLWVKKEEEESSVWHHPLWHGICLATNTISLIWDNKVILNIDSTYIYTHVRARIDRQMQHTHTSTHVHTHTYTHIHRCMHLCTHTTHPTHPNTHRDSHYTAVYQCPCSRTADVLVCHWWRGLWSGDHTASPQVWGWKDCQPQDVLSQAHGWHVWCGSCWWSAARLHRQQACNLKSNFCW